MGWFSKTFWGTDADEDQARANAADAGNRALTAKLLADGKISQAAADEAEANYQRGYIADYNKEITDAFDQGFSDNLSTVRSTIGKGISLPFYLIPWQGYALLAVVLFLYMGGGKMLKGILKK